MYFFHPRYVWPDSEVWCLYCGCPAWFPAASLGLHPTTGGAEGGFLGCDRPHHQPTMYGALCWQREQVLGGHFQNASYTPISICMWGITDLSFMVAVVCFWTRGGVLEAEGTVEIKFRRKELVKTMRRLDSVYANLVQQLGKSSFCL